ncbi:hypothetical protein J2S08_000098 [Bacillus chungangensis]|uniref:Transposase n=1 Tax=Bacillus chungangensis TaxID=587633 RepID=A0ABT9WM15_9BACI|nr:hypothetical protein [Bacillus chungangensis]
MKRKWNKEELIEHLFPNKLHLVMGNKTEATRLS